MTDLLKELRELEKAATPGPWCVQSDITTDASHIVTPIETVLVLYKDCRLAADARNALPALLDVVEAAKGYLQALDRWGDVLHDKAMTQFLREAAPDLRTALARLDGDDRG